MQENSSATGSSKDDHLISPTSSLITESINSISTGEEKEEENCITNKVEETDEILKRENIKILEKSNYKIYVIGTAHVSKESANQVKELIELTNPSVVIVELCSSRKGVFYLKDDDNHQQHLESAAEKESHHLSFLQVLQKSIQGRNGRYNFFKYLLSYFTQNISKQLNINIGIEFRSAYNSAKKINSKIILGDRPIEITLLRCWSTMSFLQKLKFIFHLLMATFTTQKLTIDDIERLKNKDILTEMLEQFGVEFPQLSKVIIDERDAYLAHSLLSSVDYLEKKRLKREEKERKRILEEKMKEEEEWEDMDSLEQENENIDSSINEEFGKEEVNNETITLDYHSMINSDIDIHFHKEEIDTDINEQQKQLSKDKLQKEGEENIENLTNEINDTSNLENKEIEEEENIIKKLQENEVIIPLDPYSVVCVVGAGHLEGISHYFHNSDKINISEITKKPKRKQNNILFLIGIIILIISLILLLFFK